MLKNALTIAVIVAVSMLASGCGSPATPTSLPVIKAAPGQQFSLAVSQKVEITGENLTVKFNNVSEDSRCPKNVVCIWEGRAVCNMTVQNTAGTSEFVLTQPGLTASPTLQEYQGYQYSFGVEPYPVAGTSIAKSDYRLVMSVSRKAG